MSTVIQTFKPGSTTKECPVCGNKNLVLLGSQQSKMCVNFSEHYSFGNIIIPWSLDPGQKPRA